MFWLGSDEIYVAKASVLDARVIFFRIRILLLPRPKNLETNKIEYLNLLKLLMKIKHTFKQL